jgi:SAM-dependent methyltransferase
MKFNFQKTKVYGLLRSIYYGVNRLVEKIKGVDFSANAEDHESSVDHSYGVHYTPSIKNGLVTILKKLPVKEDESIIDIGCGKGKAMYFMSKFPFKQIDGFDISEELCNVARKNLEVLNVRNATVLCANASDFKNYNDYNYFYIFNALHSDLFTTVFENIKNSIQQQPRKVYIICLNPVYDRIILQDNSFKLLLTYNAFVMNFDVKCYTNNN